MKRSAKVSLTPSLIVRSLAVSLLLTVLNVRQTSPSESPLPTEQRTPCRTLQFSVFRYNGRYHIRYRGSPTIKAFISVVTTCYVRVAT
jgi:hypothetical protein